MVYVFLADGFEIIEAMAPVDMLRRANVEVTTVGVDKKVITSSCGIPVTADIVSMNLNLRMLKQLFFRVAEWALSILKTLHLCSRLLTRLYSAVH